MYERYAGLIFDMDGTILDTEPTHRKAWHEVLGRYGMRFDEQSMVGLNGSPTWRIAQFIIEANQGDLDPHALAQEKTAWAGCLQSNAPWAVWRGAKSLVDGIEPTWMTLFVDFPRPKTLIFGALSLPDKDEEAVRKQGIPVQVIADAGHSMSWEQPAALAQTLNRFITEHE